MTSFSIAVSFSNWKSDGKNKKSEIFYQQNLNQYQRIKSTNIFGDRLMKTSIQGNKS